MGTPWYTFGVVLFFMVCATPSEISEDLILH